MAVDDDKHAPASSTPEDGSAEETESRGTEEATSAPAPAVATRPERAEPPPLWVVPVYLAGLALVYMGERVLSALDTGQTLTTILGLLMVVIATAMRFVPKYRSLGERKQIENLLAVLSVVGLLGLGLYFLTTDSGMSLLGMEQAELETRERVEGILTVAWVALIAISVIPTIFAEAALHPMRRAERPESRRIRAAAGAGLAIALAGTYGSLAVFGISGLEVRADYSYFKTSRPSEPTKKMAKSLDEPIKVVAFFPEVSEVKTEVQRYLSELSQDVKKVQVEVTDRLLSPKRASDLGATQDGMLILVKGNAKEQLRIGTDMETARPKLKTLDRDFQEKLLKLVRSRRTAYLTAGHGELNDNPRGAPEGRGAEIVRKLLEKQNYQVRDLGLAQGLGSEVPADASVVIVLGPSERFAPQELDTLKRYVEKDGKLLMALDPDAMGARADAQLSAEELQEVQGPSADAGAADGDADAGGTGGTGGEEGGAPEQEKSPLHQTLDQLAGLVGLEFEADLLANEKMHLRHRFNPSDRVKIFSSSFSSHAAVSTLSRNAPRAAVVLFGAGSLEKEAKGSATVDFAIRSMPGTFADKNENFEQDRGAEPAKSFNIAAAVTKDADKKNDEKQEKGKEGKDQDREEDVLPDETRAFVIADADAFSDVVMANVPTNQVLFVDAVRWLTGEESFAGEATTQEDVRIEHTKEEDLIWFYASIFGAPALVLGLGITLARRGRRRGGKR